MTTEQYAAKQQRVNIGGAALQKAPDLHFELVERTQSVDSIALYYKSVMGKMAIEVMFFHADMKVNKVIAHYN